MLEQQCGHRLAEARADPPLPADPAAGAPIDPHMRLTRVLEDLRQQRRVQLLGAFLRHQRYWAVLPPMGIAGMPSLRWSQLRSRLGTTRTQMRLFIIWSMNGRISSVYGPV